MLIRKTRGNITKNEIAPSLFLIPVEGKTNLSPYLTSLLQEIQIEVDTYSGSKNSKRHD